MIARVVIAAALLAATVMVCGYWLHVEARANRASAYGMSPELFLGQRHRLSVGMDRADVLMLIKKFDSLESAEHRDTFRLNSSRPRSPLTLDWRIVVQYDKNGRVSKVTYADG